MNKINIKRMLLAALAMFVVAIALEILLEHVIAQLVLGQTTAEMWGRAVDIGQLTGFNILVNTVVALFNCAILIWLYASLRPMYGVGTKAALITSAFVIAWIFSMFVNLTNIGLLPPRLTFVEAVFEAIEFPIAMIVGAGVYEGGDKESQGS